MRLSAPDAKIFCDLRADGVTLTVDPPSRARVWREAWMPIAGFVVIAGAIALNLSFISRDPSHQTAQGIVHIATLGLLAFLLVRMVIDTWQNAGVVTRIDLTGTALTWEKLTIFGRREVCWSAESITRVWVMSVPLLGAMLRINRRAGMSLGAFANHHAQDLEWAADALRQALRVQNPKL